jgi:hypothetical protein
VPRGINAGQAMVVIGGLALLASLFVDWYEVGPLEEGVSAWTVFEIADLVLAGLALAAVASAVPARRGDRLEPRALIDPIWVPWLGIMALVFVLVTLLNDPPAARDRPVEIGAWIGLAGAALIAVGGVLSTSRISIVINSRPRERGVAPGAGEPEATEPLEPESTDPFAAPPETEEYELPPEDDRR